jgi:hypothetical protein
MPVYATPWTMRRCGLKQAANSGRMPSRDDAIVRVPADLAVLSFDNIELALEILGKRVSGEGDAPCDVTAAHVLVVRERS